MPEHLRALAYLLALTVVFFAVARRPAVAMMGPRLFVLHRNMWFALTIAAFLAHNFWLYVVIAVPLMLFAGVRSSNPAATFLALLFVLPVGVVAIPGFGVVNYLFDLSNARLLELLILLPAAVALKASGRAARFGRFATDKMLIAYLALLVLLYLRQTTFTDSLRQGFYAIIDVVLPYYVISRSVRDLRQFREVLGSLCIAVLVVAVCAAFEGVKHWLLYRGLIDALEIDAVLNYLPRDGRLRAVATAGHPISLGYLIVVGMGVFVYLSPLVRQSLLRFASWTLLTVGLLAPLSRGPWVGAAILVLFLIVTGRKALPRLVIAGTGIVIALGIATLVPFGQRFLDLLPFVGKVEQYNVDYRSNLLTQSLAVIERHPWFGSVNYLETPELQAMRQGQGIIDLVNTYIQITLQSGLVGLSLFVAFFALATAGIVLGLRAVPRGSEEHRLGRALLATLIAVLFIIFTTSSWTIVPIVYWSVAALCVGYAQLVRVARSRIAPILHPQVPTRTYASAVSHKAR